jgi:hypothetical protein
MKKTTFILMSALCFSIASCQEKISEKTKLQIQQKETFWKNRSELLYKNKTNVEYPIKKNIVIKEERKYQIYLSSSNCQYEIFIDDVFLTKFLENGKTRSGGFTGNIDLNNLLLTSGTHEIRVLLYPEYGKNKFETEGVLNLKLYYYLKNNFKEAFYTSQFNGNNGVELSQSNEQWTDKWDQENQVAYDGDYTPKEPLPLKGLSMYEWHSTFEVEVPFDLIAWRNSVNLKKEHDDEKKDIKKEVIAEYLKIHEILVNKSVDDYLSSVEERENIFKSCLYSDKNEKTLQRIEFDELMKNDEYELEPLYEETFQLEYQSYGKLVMLLHKADGEGVIRYINKKDPNDVIYLDFGFQRKKKEDKLTIAIGNTRQKI